MNQPRRSMHFTLAAVVMSALTARSAAAGETPWEEIIRGAGGEIVVDHQPHNTGGFGADTLYQENQFLPPTWQLLADDVLLTQPAVIGSVVFWGFYHFDSLPTGDEVFRVRLYDPRSDDGLPGGAVYETQILNPPRAATGRFIATSGGPMEYRFVAVLPVTMSIDADSPYWLEIVQLGGIDSHFRWEFSRTGETNGQVFNNDFVGDWTHTVAATSDTAYQLIMIPEPGTGLLVLSCAWWFCNRRQR